MRFKSTRLPTSRDGQAMVELALVMPLLTMFLFGIVIFGVGVFYQHEINNAAREAARFAATHSTTAQYWVDSTRTPAAAQPDPYGTTGWGANDRPPTWKRMTDTARGSVFGLDASRVKVAACWSGYWTVNADGTKYSSVSYDALAPGTAAQPTAWFDCHIGGIDPRTDTSSLPCPPPATSAGDDEGSAVPNNAVTVYVCYAWSPPLSGFLLIPSTVTFRAVVTEIIHRQQ
jgi:hypothetical protein